MSRDDCFYDYLRPDGGKYPPNYDLTVNALCEKEHLATPLYDKIGGELCGYVKFQVIKAEKEHPLRKKLQEGGYYFHVITNDEKSERPCVFDQELVLKDGVVVGSLVRGERNHFTGESGSEEEKRARYAKLTQTIFLPLNGEPRLVHDIDYNVHHGAGTPVLSNKRLVYYQFKERTGEAK